MWIEADNKSNHARGIILMVSYLLGYQGLILAGHSPPVWLSGYPARYTRAVPPLYMDPAWILQARVAIRKFALESNWAI